MKRRTFIVATTCIASALAAPGIAIAAPRKTLKARFVKRVVPRGPRFPHDHAFWEVFEGKDSLFKVTVRQIVRADPEQSYYTVNSVKFGKLILKSVRNKGIEKTKEILGTKL
jgi:hypothetical protein